MARKKEIHFDICLIESLIIKKMRSTFSFTIVYPVMDREFRKWEKGNVEKLSNISCNQFLCTVFIPVHYQTIGLATFYFQTLLSNGL